MPRSTGVVRLAAGIAIGILLITGCGSRTPTATPTSSSSIGSSAPLSLLPSADPFTSAIVATKSLGTARLTVDARHRDPSRSTRGTGITVLGSGQGDVTWTAGTDTYRELLNSRGLYVQTPPQTGGWEQWPVDHVSATSGFIDSLRGLGVLRDPAIAGTEQLGSVPTTRYRGWLPLTPDEAQRLGLTGTPASDAREEVTVWLDDFGHAVRVDRRAATAEDDVASRTEFSDFSVLLNLTSPSHDVTATRS